MKSSFVCKLSLKCSGKKLCDWSTCSHEEPCSVRTALRVSTPVTSCNMKNIKSNIKLCKFKENQTPCNVWWRWSQHGGVQVSERATTFHESLVWNITNKTAKPHLTREHTSAPTEDPCQRWFNEEEEKGGDLPAMTQEAPPCGDTLYYNSNCYSLNVCFHPFMLWQQKLIGQQLSST